MVLSVFVLSSTIILDSQTAFAQTTVLPLWGPDVNFSQSEYDRVFDIQIVGDTSYFILNEGRPSDPGTLWFVKSIDGTTLETPINISLSTPGIQYTYNFGKMLIDGNNIYIAVTATKIVCTASCDSIPHLVFIKSNNGGMSFSSPVIINQFAYDHQFDFANIGDDLFLVGSFDTPEQIAFMKSTDGGNSWSVPIDLSSPLGLTDIRPGDARLATDGANMYVIWLGQEIDSFTNAYASVSNNGGTTFTTQKISVNTNDHVKAIHPRSDNLHLHGSTILYAYDSDEFSNFTIIAKSTNNGLTWSNTFVEGGGFMSGSGNNIYLARPWSTGSFEVDTPSSEIGGVKVLVSNDLGNSWNPEVTIEAPYTNQNFFRYIFANDNFVWIVWTDGEIDFQSCPTNCAGLKYPVWISYSSDFGQTFSPSFLAHDESTGFGDFRGLDADANNILLYHYNYSEFNSVSHYFKTSSVELSVLTDTDGDGIPNSSDSCPTQPETINNYQDTDGCPDILPVVEISISNAIAVEENLGNSFPINFNVRLSTASPSFVTVDFLTSDGNATHLTNDYFMDSGIVIFDPGSISEQITILGQGDNEIEGNEIFSVLLQNCVNCIISNSVGTATIIDNTVLSDELKSHFASVAMNAQAVSFALPTEDLILAIPAETVACVTFAGPTLFASCLPAGVSLALVTIPESVGYLATEIANDPPDFNYAEIVVLESYETFETEGLTESGTALVNLLNLLSKQSALQQAFLTSYERYQGASIDGKKEFVLLQLSSVKLYTDLLTENQMKIQTSLIEYSDTLQNTFTDEELADLQYRLETDGFTDIEIQSLVNSGYSMSQIEEIKDSIIDISFNDIEDYAENLSNASSSFESLTNSLESFSENISNFLEKSNLQSQKSSVIDALKSIKTGDKKLDKKINKVINHITESTIDEFWSEDGNSLISKKSKKVFDEEKEAIKELLKIQKDFSIVSVSGIIDILIDVDRQLAQNAINFAEVFAGDKKVDKEIAKANHEMENAHSKLDDNKPDKAIDHYRKAWEHAQKALNSNNQNDVHDD